MKKILLFLMMAFFLLPLSGVQAKETAAQTNYMDDLNAMLTVPDQMGTIYVGMTQEDAEANWEDVAGWYLKALNHNSSYMRYDNVVRPAAFVTYLKDYPKGSPLIQERFHIGSREGYVNEIRLSYTTQYRQVATMLSNRAVSIFTDNYGQPKKEHSDSKHGSVLSSTYYDWKPQGRWYAISCLYLKASNNEEKMREFGRTDAPDSYYRVAIDIFAKN